MAALLGALGVDLIDAVRMLGVLGMGCVALSVLWWYTGRGYRPGIARPLVVGLGFYFLAAPVAVWAIGGMEQPLLAALIGISIPLTWVVMSSGKVEKAPLLALSLCLGLLCLARPDGAIFTAATVAAMFLGERISNRRPLRRVYLLLLAFPFLFVSGQLVFRLLYYGEGLPNTVLVKIAPSFHLFAGGLKYVAGGLWALFPVSLLAVASIIAAVVAAASSREKRRRLHALHGGIRPCRDRAHGADSSRRKSRGGRASRGGLADLSSREYGPARLPIGR